MEVAGHGVDKVSLKARLENKGIRFGGRTRPTALAVFLGYGLFGYGLASAKDITPRGRAHFFQDRSDFPFRVIKAISLPARGRFLIRDLRNFGRFDEDRFAITDTEGEGRTPTIIPCQHGDDIMTSFQIAADFGAKGMRPFVGAAELLAVEPDHAVVIGGGEQGGFGRDILEVERCAGPDLLLGDAVLPRPDPLRFGVKGGQGNKRSQEGCRELGVSEHA